MLKFKETRNQYKILKIEKIDKSFLENEGKNEVFMDFNFEKINFTYIFYLRMLKIVKLNIVSLKIRF